MLYQELPRIESTRLDRWARWLAPAVILGAALTLALLLLLIGQSLFAAAAVVGGLSAAAFVYQRSPRQLAPDVPLIVGPDYSLVGSALGLSREPTALTTSEGSLLIVNAAYRERFGGTRPPLELASDDQARQGLQLAKSMAWRDGAGCVAGIATEAGISPVEVERVGSRGDLLLWRFPDPSPPDPLTSAVKRVQGAVGERLAKAGVLSAVVDAKGKLLGANQPFLQRALLTNDSDAPPRFSDLVELGEDQQLRFVAEGETGAPLRAVHVAADAEGEGGAGTFLLFDTATAAFVQSANASRCAADRSRARRPRRPLSHDERSVPPRGANQRLEHAGLSGRSRRQRRQGGGGGCRAPQRARTGDVRRSCRAAYKASR